MPPEPNIVGGMSNKIYKPTASTAPPPPYPGGPVYNGVTLPQPPDDSVSALSFSPAVATQNLIVAGSWDNTVRCWELELSGHGVPKALQSMTMPILDVCWNDQGNNVFMASCNKEVHCWDLASNQTMQVAAHDAPVKTCNWIKTPMYSCLMTGSWDKTLKFWDLRSSNPMLTINLNEKVYCADVDYPIAVVGTSSKGLLLYKLEGQPELVRAMQSPLKYQHSCLTIFKDMKTQIPDGFGIGSVEGRAAIEYLVPTNSKVNFTFKCHRQYLNNSINIYAVNDIKFHPVHGTLLTAGSDASYTYWDKNARVKLKSSEQHNQAINKCCFNLNGQIFAYSIGYDWSKGHEYNDLSQKPQIFLKPCFEDSKPKVQ